MTLECDLPLVRAGTIRYFTQHYIVPFQLIFGLAGGMVTLIVLNCKSMRNKTTVFLTCLLSSDLLFILSRTTLSLATFSALAENPGFRRFYYASKIPFIQMANWTSAASVWFALSVTMERTLAIRSPFTSHVPYNTSRIVLLIMVIISGSFVVTFYIYIWYEVDWANVNCEATANSTNRSSPRIILRLNPILKQSVWLKIYVRGSIITCIFVVVLLPLGAISVLNCSLLHYLRKNQSSVLLLGRSSNRSAQRHQERKITGVVCVIICSFIIFNLPSVFVQSLHFFTNTRTVWFGYLADISNNLVLCGKSINFLLYCMSSKHFRQRFVDGVNKFIKRRIKPARTTDRLEMQPLCNASHRSHRQERIQIAAKLVN